MNHHHFYHRKQSGFTLIELMIVVVILSIFAGLVSLSVGSSDARKNKAFYDNFVDTLKFMRLVSAERMQPLGVGMGYGNNAPNNATNNGLANQNTNGGNELQAFALSNAYTSYQKNALADDAPKNAMELSALNDDVATKTPKWVVDQTIDLPTLPKDVEVIFLNNQLNPQSASNYSISSSIGQQLQPWFEGAAVPKLLWFGTGQATPMMIEIRYQGRLIDDVIYVQPDGSIQVGNSQLVDKLGGTQ